MDPSLPRRARLVALHSYPLKSARGLAHASILLGARGLIHDRAWMLVDRRRRFISQREQPRLALLSAVVDGESLLLAAPGLTPIVAHATGHRAEVQIWRDHCRAIDAGDEAAEALGRWLGCDCRLVRFADDQRRLSAAQWTDGLASENAFSDGFPLLLLNRASLDDLNSRLARPLPVNRFRPNLVFEGLGAWQEDRLHELRCGQVLLRAVKPCTRCVITTTEQDTGERDGDEPLRTLRGFRHDAALAGVTFCQNLIIVAGVGARLAAGSDWALSWR